MRTVLYTGVTNNLHIRLGEHKEKAGTSGSFRGKYLCIHILYDEVIYGPMTAINREKRIKRWTRAKKIENLYKPEFHALDAPENNFQE